MIVAIRIFLLLQLLFAATLSKLNAHLLFTYALNVRI